MEKKRILVTGGLGFIGSHTVVELLNCGYHVCIVDNLGNASPKVLDRINEITGKGDEELTFIEGDLRDSALLDKVFTDFKPLGVIHFAAFKAVGESVAKPLEYYDNNLGSTITLLKTMEKHHCNLMIFSSSSCTYGENAYCHETDPI
jgi:UDP-glucose 4-epimerase